jgi:hypothetical protein
VRSPRRSSPTTAAKEAAGANKAVNNRQPHEKPLYEMVKDTYVLGIANSLSLKKFELWYDGYDGGPLDTGQKAQAFVDRSDKCFDDLRVHLDQIEQRVEEIRSEVLADVMKYGCPVAKREADQLPEPGLSSQLLTRLDPSGDTQRLMFHVEQHLA